ncbi:MAG: ABC transporter ATP-binding protein [Gemmatimonadetes bacterium]|nr:ABC transporter ATP-binding protein [Gemmatimonadota bacterium]
MTDKVRAALPIDLGGGPFAVTTRGLAKRFGSVRALDGLDLQVPEGAVYVLVGPNGAGKSTLIRTLMGLVSYQGGAVDVLGRDPADRGAEVRAGVGYVPEDHRLGYAWMTVGRLLEHQAVYYPSWDAEYARRLRERYEIDPGRKCHTLSKGQSRRVQLVVALAHRPPLLLLDEPTDGLDHVVRDETLSILSEHLADSPTTVVISTHRVYEVEPLVDHVGVLSEGRLLGQLPRDELQGRLLRYWADVPEAWREPGELAGRVVRRSGAGRAIEWTVWGDRDAVARGLSRAGAAVREVAPLSVDEAAVALLSGREAS